MGGGKSPLQSLTIMSAAASALVSIFALFGVNVDPALADQGVQAVGQMLSAALAVIAVYGRIRAEHRIGRDDA
jgi:uncharacterized membrane protein